MKVGETWKLKPSISPNAYDANYHRLVKISELGPDFVRFTDTNGEFAMSYYNGLPRNKFVKVYAKVYEE